MRTKDVSKQASQTEVQISNAEDEIKTWRAKVDALESKGKALEEKVMDLEYRSQQKNLRLINLQVGIEGQDPCQFLEKLLPETLGTEAWSREHK